MLQSLWHETRKKTAPSLSHCGYMSLFCRRFPHRLHFLHIYLLIFLTFISFCQLIMQATCSLFIRRMRIFGPLNKRGGVYSFGYSIQHYSRESFSSQWQQVWHLCGVFSHLRYRARVRQKPCFLFEHVKIAWILMQTFFFREPWCLFDLFFSLRISSIVHQRKCEYD